MKVGSPTPNGAAHSTMVAGPPPRGAAEAEPLLDTSARLVDIKNARRIAQFLTSVIALATFVVLAIHNGTAGYWGGVVSSRPSTSASPNHVPITGRSRLARRVDDTPDATRRALRRERLEIDELVAQLGAAASEKARRRQAPSDASTMAASVPDATSTATPPPTETTTNESPRHRSARTKNPTETDWVTPMYLLHVPDDPADEARLRTDLVKLVAAHGVAAVKKNVRLTPTVDAARWPRDLDRAVYALKSVFGELGGDYREPDLTLVKDLSWIKAVDARDARGRLREPWNGDLVASRVSALFSHMAQWQLARDNGNEHTYVVDARDGLNPWLLSVPVSALGSIAHNAPKDYDVVFVNQPLFTGGRMFSRFPDHAGNTVQLHEWEQRGVVGLGAYLFSDRFVEKVFKHVAAHGADDLDWWLVDRMCTADSVNDAGVFVGFDDAKDATRPMLRCYHALGVLDEGENGGGLTFKKREGRRGRREWEAAAAEAGGGADVASVGAREGRGNPLGLRGETYARAADWIVRRAEEAEAVRTLTSAA